MEEHLSVVDPEESKPSNVKKTRSQKPWYKNSLLTKLKPIGLIQLMLLVSFLGFILFISAAQAVYLLLYQTNTTSSALVLIAVFLVAAFLFLLDALIMILYWQYTYDKKGKCLPCNPDKRLTILYQKPSREEASEILEARRSNNKSNVTTRDISTSCSQTKWESSHSGFLDPRRQYVDRATNPDLNTSVKIIETQTQEIEPAKQIDHEISAIAVVEERDAQTLSECPMCSAALDYSPEEICPNFLNMIQSFGMLSCPGSLQTQSKTPVLVDRGTLLCPDSVTESTIMQVTKKPPRVYETRACPTHGAGLIAKKAGLPNPVKRITLTHSIKKHKRTQTPGIRLIEITEKWQNTEIDTSEETTNTECSQMHRGSLTEPQSCQKVDIRTGKSGDLVQIKKSKTGLKAENSPQFGASCSGQKSFEVVKAQVRESSRACKMENEKASVSKEESLACNVRSRSERKDFHSDSEKSTSQKKKNDEIGQVGETSCGKYQAATQGSNLLVEIKESGPQLEDGFISTRDISSGFGKNEKTSTGSTKGSSTDQNHGNITSQRNIFKRNNKVESSISTRASLLGQVSSRFAEVSSSHESPIYPVEISRYSDRSREMVSPVLPCKCGKYYYKDVFGRDICTLCAPKYLIKIPQRCTAKTVGDRRCCSCYQAISYQTPTNAGHTKCCKCRYQMYAGSKK